MIKSAFLREKNYIFKNIKVKGINIKIPPIPSIGLTGSEFLRVTKVEILKGLQFLSFRWRIFLQIPIQLKYEFLPQLVRLHTFWNRFIKYLLNIKTLHINYMLKHYILFIKHENIIFKIERQYSIIIKILGVSQSILKTIYRLLWD